MQAQALNPPRTVSIRPNAAPCFLAESASPAAFSAASEGGPDECEVEVVEK